MTISTSENSCAHEASDIHFNKGEIMQCIVMYATGVSSCLSKTISEIWIFNFRYLSFGICTRASIWGSKSCPRAKESWGYTRL